MLHAMIHRALAVALALVAASFVSPPESRGAGRDAVDAAVARDARWSDLLRPVDSTTGEPVADATVVLVRQDGTREVVPIDDAVRAEDLARASVAALEAAGHCARWFRPHALDAGAREPLRVALAPAASLEVRFVADGLANGAADETPSARVAISAVLPFGLVDPEREDVGERSREKLAFDGRAVTGVEARGKHLFVHLGARAGPELQPGSQSEPEPQSGAADAPLTLQSHLGMYGSWHRYRRGEDWTAGKAAGRARLRSRATASIVLETARRTYVCFGAKEVAVLDDDGAAFARARRLGPDLVERAPTAAELLPRVARFVGPDAPLVDLVLDQRVASGVGNVHASEVLFAEGLHPLTAVGALDERKLEALFARAHAHLAANVGPGPRVTRARDGRGHLAVYGREGLPCLRCGAAIESARLGRGHRVTSWCPRCQPRGDRIAGGGGR